MWTRFYIALTFLTRFGRARITSSDQISRSLCMYPLVGAVIGALLISAAQIPLNPWIKAWLLCLLNIYITRALHWDGWADLWDGWGSGASGERFWEIVKDSRIGAFGTIGLIVGIGMNVSLYEIAIDHHAWISLGWSCVFGRFCCLILARLGQSISRPGLGQTALQGATLNTLFVGLGTTFVISPLLPGSQLLASVAISAVGIAMLFRFARSHGAVNGDFLGASIIVGELSALLPLAF